MTSDILFKRELHPVGQGAFFTEQFFVNGIIDYTIVYDCGTVSKKCILNNEIDRTLISSDGTPTHVNLLIISHVDSDHVNGIPYLISKGYVGNWTTVIIPFNHPLLFSYMIPILAMPSDTLSAMTQLFQSKAKIIGIGGGDEPFSAKDRLFQGIQREDTINKQDNFSSLPERTNLLLKNCWHYIPRLTRESPSKYYLFKKQIKNENIEISRLNDASYISDPVILNKLRKIYGSDSADKDGVTLTNLNSLQLLSFANKNVVNNSHWSINSPQRYLTNKYPTLVSAGFYYSCLYTGDAKMDDGFMNMVDQINREITSISMIQIPHHGRMSCFYINIFTKNFISSFTNYDTTHNGNDYNGYISNEMSMSSKPYFEITENYLSRLSMLVWL